MNKQIMILMVLGFMGCTALAVDGYKDLKFGMTPKEAAKAKSCNIVIDTKTTSEDGAKIYLCQLKEFMGSNMANSGLFFLNNKLALITNITNITDFKGYFNLMTALRETYGKCTIPSDSYQDEYFAGKHQFLDTVCADGAVVMRISGGKKVEAVTLLYKSKDYEKLAKEQKEKTVASLKKDL